MANVNDGPVEQQNGEALFFSDCSVACSTAIYRERQYASLIALLHVTLLVAEPVLCEALSSVISI